MRVALLSAMHSSYLQSYNIIFHPSKVTFHDNKWRGVSPVLPPSPCILASAHPQHPLGLTAQGAVEPFFSQKVRFQPQV